MNRKYYYIGDCVLLRNEPAGKPVLVTHVNYSAINAARKDYVLFQDSLKAKVHNLYQLRKEIERNLDRALVFKNRISSKRGIVTTAELATAHTTAKLFLADAILEMNDAVHEFINYLQKLYGPEAEMPTAKRGTKKFVLPDRRIIDLDKGTMRNA